MVDYQLLQAPYSESLLDELHALALVALGSVERAELAWRLRELPRSTVLVARAAEHGPARSSSGEPRAETPPPERQQSGVAVPLALPGSATSRIEGAQLLGFKIGYAVARARYYSWLGAVHPGWRRQGIALAMLERQHSWLLEHGFTAVETVTVSSNLPMLNLNLRAGFRLTGNYCREDHLRVLLAKTLSG